MRDRKMREQRCQVWGTKNAVLENAGLIMQDLKMQDRKMPDLQYTVLAENNHCRHYMFLAAFSFTVGKMCEIWSRFSTAVTFESLSSQHIGNLKHSLKAPMIYLPQVWYRYSSLSSIHYNFENYRAHRVPFKNGLGKFVESPRTQPRIARFCWNLVDWCVIGP